MSRIRERKTSTSYALGLLCECGARRSDGSRRWCAEWPVFESAMGDEQRRGRDVAMVARR